MSIIHLLYCNPFFSIIKVMPTSDINSQSPVASTETRTLLDILLSSKLITKEQYDDVKVKSASQGVSQETVIKNYERAKNLLKKNMKVLKNVAAALLEKETLDGEEFAKLVGKPKAQRVIKTLEH